MKGFVSDSDSAEASFLIITMSCVERMKCVRHLDVPDEPLGGRVDGRLAVDDVLDGVGPARGLVQQLAVETVRVFPAVHDHVPVA